MSENTIIILECCKTKDYRHFVKDASSLSCGHLICKECLPTNDNDIIKCDLCGETNQAKLESLKITKESHMCTYLFNENIKSILKETGDRLKQAINRFKETHSEEFINPRFDFMKEEIELKVDSLKCELDALKEKLFEQVDELKNKISLKLKREYFTTETLKDFETCFQREARATIFDCQDKIKRLVNQNRQYLKKNFQEVFIPSNTKIDIQVVGKIQIPGNGVESVILDDNQKEDLILLCEFPDSFRYSLLYRATRDGFKASDFHRLCDNHSGTLVIIKSNNNCIFGGYTSQTWNDTGNYKAFIDEFLFSLTNPSNKPVKFDIKNEDCAIYCDSRNGPIFGGGHDIYVCSNSNTYNGSYSSLGYSYNGSTYYLTGSVNFLTSEIEVFKINRS